MPLWEFRCTKCDKEKDLLTSEVPNWRSVVVGDVIEADKCDCGCRKYRRVVSSHARTAGAWKP